MPKEPRNKPGKPAGGCSFTRGDVVEMCRTSVALHRIFSDTVSSVSKPPSKGHSTTEDGRSVANQRDRRATATESSPKQCRRL